MKIKMERKIENETETGVTSTAKGKLSLGELQA